MTDKKKRPEKRGLTGQHNEKTNYYLKTAYNNILPELPLKNNFERRRDRRAALRFVAQRIEFFGRRRYRLARQALGLRPDVSIFDLDSEALAQLGQAINEGTR